MTQSSTGRAALLAAALLCGFAANAFGAAPPAQVNVTTYHYDNLRTGWDQNESVLNANTVQHVVSGERFELTSFTTLDDQVDTQPLIVTNETITGKGVHNVVYVETENNSIYAIDANTGQILLGRNLGAPVPISALPGGCNNNANNVGIGGTPVIDSANNLMYVISYTYTANVQKYVLHEINLSTLADVVPKILVSASARLNNSQRYYFNQAVSRQRAALLLANGNVYAAFASFCDVAADQSRGWVLGWQTGSLTPLPSNELTNGLSMSPDNFFLSSIWMSGYGLASSASGDIYFVTGNSDYSGTTLGPNNLGESAVQMSADLSTVKSVFTPSNASGLDMYDTDFGSGGIMLLPPQPGQTSNLAVAAGKDGNMYFLDADNLVHTATGASRNLGAYGIGGCWCGQSYYTGSDGKGRIVSSGGNSIGLWKVNIGTYESLVNSYFSDGIVGDQDPGFMTAVSSNGTMANTAVIWAVSRPDSGNNNDVSLYAFNSNTGAIIFNAVAGSWPNTGGNANIAPVVANGQVYVASYRGLAIFGLSSGPAATIPGFGVAAVARVALAPGQHEIFGMVRAINGWSVTVAKRDGTLVTVDTLAAAQSHNFAEPAVGHGILVRGTYKTMTAMTADVVLHAKDHPGMWQSDR